LDELLQLKEAWAGQEVFFITYQGFGARQLGRVYLVNNWAKQPWLLALIFGRMLFILLKERPSAIVSTGAEIALPVFVLGWIMRIPRVFIESYCRVRSASATGKFVYRISSLFLVQWPGMLPVYGPKAKFWGSVY
jgi:beta-1,4-N-acetylglucosaminyltransferase